MMQLIVLGVIPGTDIQLTFELLANILASIVVLLLLRSYIHFRRQQTAHLKTYRLRTISSKINNLIPHSL